MNGIRQTGSQLATTFPASPRFVFTGAAELPPTRNDGNGDEQSTKSNDDMTLESLPHNHDGESSHRSDGGDIETHNGSTAEEYERAFSMKHKTSSDERLDAIFIVNDSNCTNKDPRYIERDHSKTAVASDEVVRSSLVVTDADGRDVLMSRLEDCIHQNPISLLSNHYVKHGVTSGLSSSFLMTPLNLPGKASPYWKVEFTCPVSGRVFESGLGWNNIKADSCLRQAIKRAFGDYEVMDNDQIVFSTKKGAKRSAAFAAFHSLGGSSRAATPTKTGTTRDYPNWVNELYRLGVKASNLTISYQEEVGDSSGSSGGCWDCRQPTLLSCVLTIDNASSSHENPTTTIQGIPQPTKERALDQAIFQLSNTLEPMEVDPKINEQIEKERLLSCNATDAASYAMSLPSWANAPIPDASAAVFHVYELEFESESGQPLLTKQSGCKAGPLGIAFPRDIQPLPQLELTFETGDLFAGRTNDSVVHERIVARLRKRFVVNLGEIRVGEDAEHSTTSDRLAWMKEFSRMLSHFKTYARTRGKPVSSRLQGDEVSPSDRTYLFVPLTRHVDKAMTIDWDVLERVASHDCRRFVVATTQRSPLQVVVLLLTFILLLRQLYVGTVLDSEFKLRNLFSALGMVTFYFLVSESRVTHSPKVAMNHFLVQTSGTGVEVYVELSGSDTGLSHFARYFRGYFIPCKDVSSRCDSDLLIEGDSISDHVSYVFSRGLVLLPMPRHYLSLARHFSSVMPLVEREIELSFASTILQKLSSDDPVIPGEETLSLASLLREATTLTPKPTYQRLEFLGDAVLGFFVSIMIMAGNPSLSLSYDELGDCLSMSTKNTALYDAALRIGANHVLLSGQRACRWRSRYSGNKFMSKLMRSCHEKVADSVMSDVVESLLGATYLHDASCDSAFTSGESVSATLFKMLQLPVSVDASTRAGVDLLSLLLSRGYPFHEDTEWQEQLASLNSMFDEDRDVLDNSLQSLVGTLAGFSQQDWLADVHKSETFRTLLTSAINHDDDADGNSCFGQSNDFTNRNDSLESAIGAKQRLCRFREMLSLVGAYALQLCITMELFERYPDANERDLHTLRARAIADDVVVYIMFQARIHEPIFRMDHEVVEKFQLKMTEADMYGREAWATQGGWILPGGEAEFTRRCRTSPRAAPQYPGYAGGRLFGSKNKLNERYTEQHMFVMKAIVGALVLSCGMQPMWDCIGPLFDEVMLLSVEESFAVYDSNIK